MRSLRKNNLTIQSIRLEIFEKSNWISKRCGIVEDEEQRERIFLPSRRYLQPKPARTECKGQRDRIVSQQIEKVIYRSVFMKQAYERDKKRQSDNNKDMLEVHCPLRRSKTSLKVDALCKHLSSRSEVFIKNDMQTQGKTKNKRFLTKMQRPPSIAERKYSTQPNEEITRQKKSLLLTPINLQQELAASEESGTPPKRKGKRPELLRRINKHHKFSLKSKETQISPWRSDNLIQTLYPFAK